MTIDEMKLAVFEKLNYAGIVEPCCLKSNCRGWLWAKSGKAIDWEYHGLQVCHEAEKLLTWVQGEEYAMRVALMFEGNPFKRDVLFLNMEHRLEALCRVWWPERFLNEHFAQNRLPLRLAV